MVGSFVCLAKKSAAQLFLFSLLVEGGQRFVLEDTGIKELSEEEAPARIARPPLGHQNTAPASVGDESFYMRWFRLNHGGDLVQLGNESRWNEWPSPSALAVLMKKSIFCLGTTGHVYERFHNQVKWVYVKHENPSESPLVSLTAVRNRGTYFASDAEGA
jgi:hypothetical protein